MAKIKVLDINGNWVWLDTTTNQTTSIIPLTGTIQINTTRSVGGNKNTKRGRTLIAHNLVQNYNNRQTKVHNYGDLTRRLKLKHQTVSVDNNGEPIINLTDYNPGVEAPMKPYTPLEEFYVGAKVLDLPFKFGSKAIQYGLGRYGSRFGWNEALLSARNKILSDVFDRLSLKLITPQTTSLLYLTLKFTPTTPNEEGALTFFLRKPSKISVAERTEIPKGEAPNPGMRNPTLILSVALKIKLVTQKAKTLWNNGKLILKDIPRKAENFYRAVNKDAINDAKKYKIIRGRKSRDDNYPFFGRSSEPYHDTKYVIEGTPESADWISTYKYVYNKNPEIVRLPKIPDRDYSKAYDTIIGSPESNGFLRIGAYDKEFLEGYEALPMTNGQLNVSPSSNFVYWKKYPIIGWRKYNFKQGGKINWKKRRILH